MTFGIYLIGLLILLVGVVLGGHYMGIPGHWIAVAGLVIGGFAILVGVSRTRRPDAS